MNVHDNFEHGDVVHIPRVNVTGNVVSTIESPPTVVVVVGNSTYYVSPDECERKVPRNDVLRKLATGIVYFEFIKKDGTTRKMHATLDFSRIPKEKYPKGDGITSYNTSLLRVFDVDIGEWRTVNLDTVTHWSS